MDPVSAITGLVGLVDVALRATAAIVSYARDTRHASRDKKLLAEEAHILSKLLERLKQRALGGQDEAWLAGHAEVVRQFEAAFQDLATILKIDTATGKQIEEPRTKAILSAAKWSFTKSEVYSLLQRIERLRYCANELMSDAQQSILDRLDQQQQEALIQKKKAQILSWLSPLEMSRTHQTISDRAERGSGKWFLESEPFLKWRTGEENPLWCWGIPGAGKTVIASIITNYLRQSRPEAEKQDVGITVIYLRYSDPDQTLDNLLGSILKQLLQEADTALAGIFDLYEYHHDRNTSPSLDEIAELLGTTIDAYKEFYLVIDGLDECGEQLRWDLIEQVEKFLPKLRLLITSRYLSAIDEELEDFTRFEIKANKADIELFVDVQIQKNRNLRRIVQRAPNLRSDIKAGVVKTAEDMFLLARLHVEALSSAAGLSVRHVRQRLRELPTTLTGSYESAMRRITDQEPDHRRIAFKTLAWVSYALRALSLRELQHALAIEPGDTELDEELMMDGQSITALCAGLVIIDQGSNMVNLVHYSTKSYFEKTRKTYFPNYHASITQSCATYLTLRSLQNLPINRIVQGYPLASYAAQYLGDHARNTPEDALEPSILEAICQLLIDPNKRKPLLSLLDGLDLIRSGYYSEKLAQDETNQVDVQNLFSTVMPASAARISEDYSVTSGESTLDISSLSISDSTLAGETESVATEQNTNLWAAKLKASRIPEVTALHLAASMGLAKVASMLLKETANIDAVDETGKTALTVAMERGFEKAVEFLINSGASVDLHDEHGRSVLLLIAERNWRTAGDIIAAKAKSRLEGEGSPAESQVQFILGAYSGDVDEVKRVSARHSLDLQGKDRGIGETALFLAVEHVNAGMVQYLLHAGIDVNAKDNQGQGALFKATRRRDENMIKLLLVNRVDVDGRDDEGRTAWSANVRSRDTHILGLLVAAGADPSTRGLQGVSELYTAARNGEVELVKFMLESGTNPSVQTEYDWAPLHWASAYGHVECVDILIQAGADVRVRSDEGVTPLELAIKSNQHAVVDMLRRAGADQNGSAETQETTSENSANGSGWVHIFPPLSTPAVLDDAPPLDDKLFLVYDNPLSRTLIRSANVGQFIYPRKQKDFPAPDGYIYQVSHVLEAPTPSMSIRRAPRRAEMNEYPLNEEHFNPNDILYDLYRKRSDYQEFELHGRHQNPLPGTFRMHKDWTGSWKIHRVDDEDNQLQFRTTPDWSALSGSQDCRWITEEGLLLARSGWDDETPNLSFEPGLPRQMVDLIVSCLVLKLWAETALQMGVKA